MVEPSVEDLLNSLVHILCLFLHALFTQCYVLSCCHSVLCQNTFSVFFSIALCVSIASYYYKCYLKSSCYSTVVQVSSTDFI